MRAFDPAAQAGRKQRSTLVAAVIACLVLLATTLFATPGAGAESASAGTANGGHVTWLHPEDFTHGTYIIDRPGTYKLASDISFNPNSPATLDQAAADGSIDPATAAMLDLSTPVDAYRAGWPLATQFLHGPGAPFTPGGPTDPRYDPAAFGVGFFAAIAVQADNVKIDLNGHTIEQSAEHALLQRFFAVIELADQPFVPAQGPSGFGDELRPANNVVIKNGTIGRSAHHGIHGNDNRNVKVKNVDFVDYEVGAIALNGVRGLKVKNVTASNRTDVPVLGTFSSARFISVYIDELIRSGSATTLEIGGETYDATRIRTELRATINNTHQDVVATGEIDRAAHPTEHAVFDNPERVVDGNSYSFLINQFGVAVDGFPTRPGRKVAARNIKFTNVHVTGQHSSINEIPALATGSEAMIDPVGAVFQVQNLDPVTGDPVTVSDIDPTAATYTGNPVANAQAFVAKALANGDFAASRLDVSRVNLTEDVLRWVERAPGAETLADIGATFLCNGDSMFHVNKGAIGFKIDAAINARLRNTSVDDLTNTGAAGAPVCDYDRFSTSHPKAALNGYGGAAVRGYTFAGSKNVRVRRASATDLTSSFGTAAGFDVLTDSKKIRLHRTTVDGVHAGAALAGPHDSTGPNHPAVASGWHIGPDAARNHIVHSCLGTMTGAEGVRAIDDEGSRTKVLGTCKA